MYLTQGKLRENTGNFISAGMWPPWQDLMKSLDVRLLQLILWNMKQLRVKITMEEFNKHGLAILKNLPNIPDICLIIFDNEVCSMHLDAPTHCL